jgi:hypothetical protein
MDNPVTTFLSLVVPWATTGYVNLHWPYLPPDLPAGSQPLMPGRAFQDIGAALRYVNARRANSDLFVCMSLQAEAKPIKKHGRNVWSAKRRKRLALLLRSFWLDVDIKNGFFRDTQHALEVFGEWRRAMGLPPPTLIVLTGSGGFHAYWVLDEPIDAATWQPLADALANAAGSLKPMPGPDGEERRLDIGLTTNPACLLRIPNSFNFKHNPPKLAQLAHVGVTYPFSVIDEALAKHKGTYSPARPAKPTTLKASPVFAGMAKPVPLAAGLDDRWRPTAKEVADGCPWFARVKHTNGAGCSEPEWFESLQVAFFCQQGNELAHEISSGHPTYVEEETDHKFALVEESHASGRLGWPQCKTIQLNGASECRLCEHLPKGQSPINFASKAPVEEPLPIVSPLGKQPIVLQPTGYYQDPKTLLVYKEAKEDSGTDQPVCLLPIFNVDAQLKASDGSGKSVVMFDTYIAKNQLRHAVVSYLALGDARLFNAQLVDYDIVVDKLMPLGSYLRSFVEQLWHIKNSSPGKSEPYGWSTDESNKRTGFVVGELRYNCAGITRVAPLDLEIARHYRPTGSIECFKKNAALITQQERYDLMTVLATAVGAPLTALTGVRGLVLHAYGPGGLGKSHASMTAQSFWSNPVLEQSILDDTANYLIGKLAMLRNMPLYYDDVKGKGITDEMLKLIFAVTLGRSKGRAKPTGDLREVHEFSTMLTIVSNNSLVDYIQEHDKTSNAALDRVFEIPVQPNATGIGRVDRTDAQQAMGELAHNYGLGGALCAEFLGKNIEAIETAVRDAQKELNRIVDGNDAERFWVATMAVCYIGARIANKLGLTEINEKKLLEFLIANFHRLRSIVGSSPTDMRKPGAVESFIHDYVNSRQRAMIITDRVPQGPGRVANGAIHIRSTELRDGVRVRYAYDDRLLRISAADFRDWLRNHRKVGPHEIIQAIKATLPAKFFKVSLATGTSFSSVREEVIELDLTNMPDFINLS